MVKIKKSSAEIDAEAQRKNELQGIIRTVTYENKIEEKRCRRIMYPLISKYCFVSESTIKCIRLDSILSTSVLKL